MWYVPTFVKSAELIDLQQSRYVICLLIQVCVDRNNKSKNKNGLMKKNYRNWSLVQDFRPSIYKMLFVIHKQFLNTVYFSFWPIHTFIFFHSCQMFQLNIIHFQLSMFTLQIKLSLHYSRYSMWLNCAFNFKCYGTYWAYECRLLLLLFITLFHLSSFF